MFLKLSKLLDTFLNRSLKVLQILNELIFCNHAVVTVCLFRSLVLVCSRDIADMVGSSEMSAFTRLGSAKPVVFHKEGKCIYSTMFLILKNYWCVSLPKMYTYLGGAYQYISYHNMPV